ncbi:hypothetical protein ABL78_7744 [Leptomonas seymouri]|uniref:Uncharacterized protein n=1 Tax=Leptomonas seymouri TaxID=5684 RepID=A0A0N1IHN4_LEPSE|nr:hypothetical protein ABL78_7744 [Leptomonas seymouri]|eukprot:KPI83228.1 hypothetical protein ABL78_7744 [Leptomonas seymouri]
MPPKHRRAAAAAAPGAKSVTAKAIEVALPDSGRPSDNRSTVKGHAASKPSTARSAAPRGKRPPSASALSSAVAAVSAKRRAARAGSGAHHQLSKGDRESKPQADTVNRAARGNRAMKRAHPTTTATAAVPPPPPGKPLKKARSETVVVAAATAARAGVSSAKSDAASTISATADSGGSVATAAFCGTNSSTTEATALSAPYSLLWRYLPTAPSVLFDGRWNASDAAVFSAFLAQVQLHLVRCCCRLLARLTTATSPAFLHAAALGAAALASPSTAEDGTSTNAGNSTASPEVDPLVDRQEEAYRTIRATIAASCTLGHRSCQVLWGPRGSGKHRILRLLAQEVRRTSKTFVMELHGKLLRDDEAALGVVAQQLLAFLQSPQSHELRAAHYQLRTGSFGFGQLFNFQRRMQEAGTAVTADEGGTANNRSTAGRRGGAASGGAMSEGSGRPLKRPYAQRGRRSEVFSSDSNSDSTEEDLGGQEEPDGVDMMVTSTTTYLTGGAASALPHLQQVLLLLKSQGCSIVVCIRDIDVFGVRCDQLLYVLSGLMHDSENSNGGGGLSLVLASAAPDIRQLEKRLSSRLTCETRYVPLLPWSLSSLLAATFHVAAQDRSFQLQLRELGQERAALLASLRDGATRLRCSRENAPQRGTAKKAGARAMKELQDAMASLETRLHAVEAKLREMRAQRRHFLGILDFDSTTSTPHKKPSLEGDSTVFGCGCESGWRPIPPPTQATPSAAAPASSQHSAASSSLVAPRSWTVESLHAQPNLIMEVQCVMCEELLQQLRLAEAAVTAAGLQTPESTRGRCAVAVSSLSSLVQRVTSLGVEVDLESGTSATVLTALVSALCKTASGEVDLMGSKGRRVLLQWMRARLQHEPIPLPAEDANAGASTASSSACPPDVPARILSNWRESAQALAAPGTATTKVGSASSAAPLLSSSASLASAPILSTESSFQCVAGDPSLALAAVGLNKGSTYHRSHEHLALPPLSLLPPHIFDLLTEGQLVGMGYGSREMILVLFYMYLHHTTGVRQRTVADLLEDVSSSLGTRAAAALDRSAFRHAIRLLCRWRLLTISESHSQSVQICGSDTRLRGFLATVLSKQPVWCEAELGLDTREVMRFRNLV